MTISFRTIAAGVAVAAFTAFAGASPSRGDASEYRVVDMQLILKDAKSAESVRTEIDSMLEKFKTYIAGKESQLRTANQNLDQNRSVLSPEDFKNKQKEFRKQVVDVQGEVQQKRAELEKARNAALIQIQDAVIGIIAKMGEEQGFDLAVPKSEVLFYQKTLDITPAVIAQLDKQLPKVKVSVPK
ncbi:MAG: OmpH family outer membrane protein [Rickettsiales bacterium]